MFVIYSPWDTKTSLCPVAALEFSVVIALLQGLVKCIGGMVMAGIMRRIAEHHRYVHAGFPDLTVWNPDTRKFKAGIDMIIIIMAALRSRCGHYIFVLWFFSSFFLLSFYFFLA